MMVKRYLHDLLINDLQEKMVFLAGPRQVGKIVLAGDVMSACGGGHYYLWDNKADRKELLSALV
jgi:predicted AAA+ superfamily ATPase